MLQKGLSIIEKNPVFFYDHHRSLCSKSMHEGHYHNFYELYYLVSGSCDYLIAGSVYSLRKNDLVFIPPNTIHRTMYTSETHERILLNFTGDFINNIIKNNLSEAFCSRPQKETDIDYIDNIFRIIGENAYSTDNLSKLLLNCSLTELLIYIIQTSCKSDKITTDASIDNALSYISQNYSQDITLEYLAGEAGYNKDYFSKLFKKNTGVGYKEYLLYTRLSAAENLLLTSNYSIQEVAFSCGFNDSNHFSTSFKKLYGMSPLKYKCARGATTDCI